MGLGRFDAKIPLPASGDITVKGPFDAQDDTVAAARLTFLIVQDSGAQTIIVQGEGEWKKGNKRWKGTVRRRGHHPQGGTAAFHDGLARGIAIATLVKPGTLRRGTFEPPTIETVTWCADFRFEKVASTTRSKAGARASRNGGKAATRARARSIAR